MRFIGQVLPVDGYFVTLKHHLTKNYSKSLTHLYQPLIGIQAVMLYQTLLHEIELEEEISPQTHHTLMNYLNIPLDEIYKARLKLEGIGLLKTFKKTKENTTIFTYELQGAFAPSDFFRDAMLSQLLYHQIGDQKYNMLKNHFVKTYSENVGEDITVSFHDVFQTFTPTLEVVKPIRSEEESPPVQTADFSWLIQMLTQRMIPVGRVLTAYNRKLISQMQLLYDLDSYEIEKSVLWALTEENYLNTEEFKTACHDLFKSKHHDSKIKLTEKVEKNQALPKSKPVTKEDMLIHELETISPKQLLEDLSGGNQASEQDMKIIREVMTSQGLPSPVMNVLIHYVLLQSNMKLSKAYLEKIASHWSRANIKTAKEAMEFAKKEKERFQKTPQKQQQRTSYKRKDSKEIVPDWFKERKVKQTKTVQSTQPVIDLEKEKAELEKLLNQKVQHNNRF
ncbi:replication initiation and membrane attachment family protein [Oceanobacillus bengalensis]|uniref:Chromosome replication initiation protein n=1 Tax=Oceanobacillus bengalensis TaxID=1435466 RepID=A0A494YX26_9BACI|nr:DnaD domain protein [Oceanobacillus bengalensis]RKQ14670.1 chromosome replication initiation protein [Oceanobacillus bengalensis]